MYFNSNIANGFFSAATDELYHQFLAFVFNLKINVDTERLKIILVKNGHELENQHFSLHHSFEMEVWKVIAKIVQT